jgi:hypothetical protein
MDDQPSAVAWLDHQMRHPPLKQLSHLTCKHGRFWRSCDRCMLPTLESVKELRVETRKRNLLLRGATRRCPASPGGSR